MSALTDAQRQHWHTNGWLLLTESLTPEVVQALSAWVDDIAAEPEAAARRLHYYELTIYGKALCRSLSLCQTPCHLPGGH